MSRLPVKGIRNNCTRCNFFLAPAMPGSVSNQGHAFKAYFPVSRSIFSIAAVTCQTMHYMFTIHYLSAKAAACPALQKIVNYCIQQT